MTSPSSPSPNPLGYACDLCGACCSRLIIEATYLDALREPRLLDMPGAQSAQPSLARLLDDPEGTSLLLYDRETHCCPFLTAGDEPNTRICSIYATRPNVCIGVLAGDAKCQQARRSAGLEELKSIGPATINADDWNQQYELH